MTATALPVARNHTINRSNCMAMNDINWLEYPAELSELERQLLTLEALLRDYWCSRTFFTGPTLKGHMSYATLDGYPLGTIVWYMECHVENIQVSVYGRSATQAVQNAIEFFQTMLTKPKKDLGFAISDFELAQRAKAGDYARRI